MKPLNPLKLTLGLLASAAIIFTGAHSARADIVHNDDVIIDGSACIGFDCVNGESFGFDTLRLKENNLRIKFDDTSTSASFPRNDWQITANDSANGGTEKFSIDDITGGRTPSTIEAGAPSHSLYVDDGGRLGLGTNTPVVDVHVKSGNTPTLRLEQDGTSGFSPQTWDLAGNETNFFIRDATSGSTLPFRLFPGASSNSLTISADNDVAIGQQTAEAPLHVVRTDGTAQLFVENTGSAAASQLAVLSSDGPAVLRLENTTSETWDLNSGGGGIFRFSDVGDADVEFQLDGSGNLTVTGTVAANGGTDTLPDYVFESDYELMSLTELETFIEKNGHLPKVPNRADVEKAGGVINMTEMQMRLLEKIEELTLYTLEQQKTIKQLQASLEKLGND